MRCLPLFAFALWLAPVPAAAQSDTATLSAALGGVARLSLSANSLSFPDADPDLVPLIAGTPTLEITAKARATEGGMVTLTLHATDDLRSGVVTIPASTIAWTATGPGFVDGTVSTAAPQAVATWIGSGIRTGTQAFRFQNSWLHPAGIFTLTLIYTLSAA